MSGWGGAGSERELHEVEPQLGLAPLPLKPGMHRSTAAGWPGGKGAPLAMPAHCSCPTPHTTHIMVTVTRAGMPSV